jgi:hypothetical protein
MRSIFQTLKDAVERARRHRAERKAEQLRADLYNEYRAHGYRVVCMYCEQELVGTRCPNAGRRTSEVQ